MTQINSIFPASPIAVTNPEIESGAPTQSNDEHTFSIMPIVTLPLLLAGPKGVVAYFAINLAACGSSQEGEGPVDSGNTGETVDDASHNDTSVIENQNRPSSATDAGQNQGTSTSPPSHYAPPAQCKPGDQRPCGRCGNGLESCMSNYQWSGICMGDNTPTAEICDGIDNNCNGVIDEGLRNACGLCGPPEPELCNGIDDDCDGQTDEGTRAECGGCACTDGVCSTPVCRGIESCGQGDECGGICQTCPTGEICESQPHGYFCMPAPLDCTATDRFLFGNDYSSHLYTASAGVHPGINPGDSCGAALGIYFDNVGDWAQTTLAVDPSADAIRLKAHSASGGVTMQADGFECGGLACWADSRCRPRTYEWHMHELTHNIAEDGAVEFTFRAAARMESRTDIAQAEVESCFYVMNGD